MYNETWHIHIKWLKQSTSGSFNSLKCFAEWKNHLSAQCYCCAALLHMHRLPSQETLLVPSYLLCTAHLLWALLHLGLSNLLLFSLSSLVIAHCKGASVLAHRCMQFAVTSMLWKWELQQFSVHVCDVSSQTWNFVGRSQGKVGLL